MFSAYTGHLSTSIFPSVDIDGPVNSTYGMLEDATVNINFIVMTENDLLIPVIIEV